MKYTHVFVVLCFVVVINTMQVDSQIIFAISFRVASLALGQSYDYPSAREVTLKDMGNSDHSLITTKQVQTMCITVGCTIKKKVNIMNTAYKAWKLDLAWIWRSKLINENDKGGKWYHSLVEDCNISSTFIYGDIAVLHQAIIIYHCTLFWEVFISPKHVHIVMEFTI